MAGITLLNEVKILLRKELMLEWRSKSALMGVVLYLIGTVFITYMSFLVKTDRINSITWNALYWIITLFIAITSIGKSFLQEGEGRNLYYYYVCSPRAIILSKIIYNACLMCLLGILTYGVFIFMLPIEIFNKGMLIAGILLGAIGFSCSLSLLSAISGKIPNSTTLMAILSFPVILPMLILLIRITSYSIDGIDPSLYTEEILLVGLLNIGICIISFILFPYLWRS